MAGTSSYESLRKSISDAGARVADAVRQGAIMMRDAMRRIGAAAMLGLLAGMAGPARGDVSMSDTVAFQALALDMMVAEFSINLGLDTTSSLTYSGSFDQNGWSGTLAGTYEGQSVSGTSDASISGDPTYKVSGETTWNGQAGPSLTMTLMSTKGGGYNLMNTMTGTQQWTNRRPLKVTTNGTMTTYTGRVYYNYLPPGATISKSYPYDLSITLDSSTGKVMSTFREIGGPKPNLIKDTGTYDQTAFLMSDTATVQAVPEPPGSVLVVMAAAMGLGYWRPWRTEPSP